MVSIITILVFRLLSELQWSHVFSDMVRIFLSVCLIGGSEASMEPCLFRHGKALKMLNGESDTVASMEPCLFRHGKST